MEYVMTEAEAIIVLRDIKEKFGRNYKSAIRRAWMSGNYDLELDGIRAHELHQIRNAFGPTWLDKVRL
jgi:hypothetical protein